MNRPRNRGNWIAALLLACALYAPPPAVFAIAVKIGQPAPDFTLPSQRGGNTRLSDLRGEVVLINFWATWCGPCREEMPELNTLYQKYRRVGFTVLAVNIDEDPNKAKAMIRRLGTSFPVLFDGEKRVSKRYDVDGMPMTFLVDRNGQVRSVHRGYRSGAEKRYEEEIRELLKQ